MATTKTPMPLERAVALAQQLTNDDDSDGWTYEARPVCSKTAVVDVYDEEGNHLGALGLYEGPIVPGYDY